jgi:hypothetical protein
MTLTVPSLNVTPAQGVKNPGTVNTLQRATNASGLAKESLKEIDQLLAKAQAGDSFALRKIQALAETALSETNGLHAAGEADVLAAVADTGYLAQATLQKVGAAQSSAAKRGSLNLVA